jgi:hypothetical protein
MHLTPDTIFEAAMNLPEGERIELAVRLMDTVPPAIMSEGDPGFLEELERRAVDDSGSIPWSRLKNE